MPNIAPITIKREGTPTWLYNALDRLARNQLQTQRGFAAIVRGVTPDQSGSPLVDLSKYFFKPGILGGQLAYGDTASGGKLILSSTASTTKGCIYLGSALTSALDEANNLLGIGTASPAARVHISVPPPSGTFLRPNSDVGTGVWGRYDSGSPLYTVLNGVTADPSKYIQCLDYTSTSYQCGVTLGTDPGTLSGHFLHIMARDTSSNPGNKRLYVVLQDGPHNVLFTGFTPYMSGTFTTYLVPVTFSVTPDFATLSVNLNPSSGTPQDGYFQIAWIALEIVPVGGVGTVKLQRWDYHTGYVDLTFASDGGGGSNLLLQGNPATSVVLKAYAGQTKDILEIQDSSGTILLGRFDAGGYFIGSIKTSSFFSDPTDPTKQLQFNLSGITSGQIRTFTFPDKSGTIALLSDVTVLCRWAANGPFIVDTTVDGVWVSPRARTVTAVWLYRTTPGTSGSTIVDIHKNGTTIYSTQANRPTLAYTETGSKLATAPDVTSVAAGDVLTIDIDQIEGGTPQNLILVIEGS